MDSLASVKNRLPANPLLLHIAKCPQNKVNFKWEEAFAVVAPELWDGLSLHIRQAPSLFIPLKLSVVNGIDPLGLNVLIGWEAMEPQQ